MKLEKSVKPKHQTSVIVNYLRFITRLSTHCVRHLRFVVAFNLISLIGLNGLREGNFNNRCTVF